MFEGVTAGHWVLAGFGFLMLCLVAGFLIAWWEQGQPERERKQADRLWDKVHRDLP